MTTSVDDSAPGVKDVSLDDPFQVVAVMSISQCPFHEQNPAPSGPRVSAEAAFAAYVADAAFPCVGAKSAQNRGRIRTGSFGALSGAGTAQAVCDALYAFLDEFPDPGSEPVSFVALFDDDVHSETNFEHRLWEQLQQMHACDRTQFAWDPTVSDDAAANDFSFSIGGRGLFVVGLHPAASRLSRQAPQPTLVFNLHAQFEALRANGKYETMQTAVRKRDLALQGSINPVLARFGEASEALQYAGRAVAPDWQCPFKTAA